MKNRFYIVLLIFFIQTVALPSFADLEELSGYFEIRDTIKLMNEEIQRGMENQNSSSLFDEEDIEYKLQSFIGFMKNRIDIYAVSDSRLKLHYVKKLNELLEETSRLFLEAKPIIFAKHENKLNKKEETLPPVSYSTIEHPYFNPIDFRALASREPLDVDYSNIKPLPAENDDDSDMIANIQTLVSNSNKERKVKEDEKQKQKESIIKIDTVLDKKVEPQNKENKSEVKPIVARVSIDDLAKEKAKQKIGESKKSNDEKIASASILNEKSLNKIVESKPASIGNKKTDIISVPETSTVSTVSDNTTKEKTVSPTGDYMRPMAIMVENHNQARPQSGLYKADVVYEIPVEGGITRFMALFTKMPGLIGPVRSCREYFVDRALEVDALYVHCGGSPMGYAYISKSKIRSIDEIKNSPPFFRDKLRKAPHNLYGNGEAIYRYMSKRVDMRVKEQAIPLSYGIRNELGTEPGDYINIRYHGNYTLVIKEENGVYHRYMNNILHLDRETKKPLEASAVVLQVAAMKVVDAVGRQEISFIGSGKAWIFEKGKRTEVTWHKDSPRTKTTYIDENGKEYLFGNNGQVWIQVVSPNHKVIFEEESEKIKEVKSPKKMSTELKNKSKEANKADL